MIVLGLILWVIGAVAVMACAVWSMDDVDDDVLIGFATAAITWPAIAIALAFFSPLILGAWIGFSLRKASRTKDQPQ